MQVQPYLFFDGRAEEALEFYKTAVGADVTSSSSKPNETKLVAGTTQIVTEPNA